MSQTTITISNNNTWQSMGAAASADAINLVQNTGPEPVFIAVATTAPTSRNGFKLKSEEALPVPVKSGDTLWVYGPAGQSITVA